MFKSCLLTSAPSKANKHRTWPCCWETHGLWIMYSNNGPEDAPVGARMEVLAMLLAVTEGRRMKAGCNTNRKQACHGEVLIWGRGVLVEHTLSERVCPSSAATTHFEIRHVTLHTPLHAFLLLQLALSKVSHKSSGVLSRPPAEAQLSLCVGG